MGDLNQIPKWHRELEIFSRIKPIIILEGNVLDRYVYPVESETGVPAGSIMPSISDYLNTFLADAGYDIVVGYDAIRGFSNIGKAAGSNSAISRFAEITGADLDNLVIDAPFSFRRNETANSAPAIIGRAVAQKEKSVAVILNFASRYIAGPQNLPIEDINAFTMLQQTGLSSTTFRKRLRDESGNTVPDQKDSLNAIYESAFGGCTNLARVTAGSGLGHIGDGAFTGCTSLESFTASSTGRITYNGDSFDPKGEEVMSHGGISIDECVVPFIKIKAVKQNG